VGRGSAQGNTQNEKSLYHQSFIDFRCYLEMALLNHAWLGISQDRAAVGFTGCTLFVSMTTRLAYWALPE